MAHRPQPFALRRTALSATLLASLVACSAHEESSPTGIGIGAPEHGDPTRLDAGLPETGTPPSTPSESASGATAIGIAPLTLIPPFSTEIHDYYVRCAAGTNALTVTLSAAPGSTIGLVQPVTTSPGAGGTGTVALLENEALVASVTTNGVSDEYWVRCIPHNFPELALTLHPGAGTPSPGYYLLGDVVTASGETGYAMVLDGHGVPVWYHTTLTGRGAVDVDSVIPGTVSFVAFLDYTFGETSGRFELHDLTANTTSYVEPAATPLDLHELQYLANGDYLLLSDPITTGVDLTGFGSFGQGADMIGCVILEVSPTGETVWQWSAADHFDPVVDSTWPQTALVSHVVVADPFHCNSVDVNSNGDLLVSARHMDSVFAISRATGAVLWKMGGATQSRDGSPYISVVNDPETSFYRQHDARWLADNELSLFDDQTEMPGPARGVIYAYDLGAGTASVVWQYAGTASTTEMGSLRVLADGSRIIGWGVGGASNRAMTEVDDSGHDLLDFGFPDGDESYRALKIPTTAFDLDVLRSGAGAD